MNVLALTSSIQFSSYCICTSKDLFGIHCLYALVTTCCQIKLACCSYIAMFSWDRVPDNIEISYVYVLGI